MRFRSLLLLLAVGALGQTGIAQQTALPPAAQSNPPPGKTITQIGELIRQTAQNVSALLAGTQVAEDRRVTFRLNAPKATEVGLTCECVKGVVPMKKDEHGVWSATVGPIEPDLYAYAFHVDGVVITDPRNLAVKTNSVRGPLASILNVPGNGPMFYDVKPVPHGKVDIRYYDSKATNSVRRAYVYTPPGYDRSTDTLPVLYLLHGDNDDEATWTASGRANLILDNLIADQKAAPMIVVMPYGYAYGPTPSGAMVTSVSQRADFEKDLIENLIPFVEANYRAATDRDRRAIAGFSMGGGQTLQIGLHHLDLFSRVAGFSATGFSAARAPYDAFKDVVADPEKVNSSLKLLWLGCGSDDSLFAPNMQFSEYLTKSGINNTFMQNTGAHTWINWRRYLLQVAPQIYPAN